MVRTRRRWREGEGEGASSSSLEGAATYHKGMRSKATGPLTGAGMIGTGKNKQFSYPYPYPRGLPKPVLMPNDMDILNRCQGH